MPVQPPQLPEPKTLLSALAARLEALATELEERDRNDVFPEERSASRADRLRDAIRALHTVPCEHEVAPAAAGAAIAATYRRVCAHCGVELLQVWVAKS